MAAIARSNNRAEGRRSYMAPCGSTRKIVGHKRPHGRDCVLQSQLDARGTSADALIAGAKSSVIRSPA
jgi:hypothetical protein